MLLQPEPVQPQAKVSPISAARSANNGPVVKSLEQAPVRTDEISLKRVEPSSSKTVLAPEIEEMPPLSAAVDTSRGDERYGFSSAGRQVISLALLAGLLGGAGGAYLLYLHQAADKGQLSSKVAAANPKTAQVRTAAPATPTGVEAKSASILAADPTAAPAPAVPTTATVSVPPARTETAPARPQVGSSPVVPASPSAPSVPPLANQKPPVTASPPAAAAGPSPAPATPPASAVASTEKGVSVTAYMSNGDLLLVRGDVASARLFYEAAANSGSAAAMTAIGRTYDPLELSRLGIKGFRADLAKAAEWYLKAKEHGDPEAAGQISRLQRWLAEAPGAK